MRILTKRITSIALAVCLCLAMLLPVPGLRADAATVYDPDAAVAYAAAHATDTPEIAGADCANFVSKCVTAGGIPVSEKVCHNLMLALEPYAAKVTNLEIVISNGYGRVPVSGSNTSILSKGDVMFVCCERCKSTGNNYERHAVIYSGESDSNGYAKCYAHTSMANNTTFWVGYNGTYACSNGHATSYLAAEVVHFESTAPQKPTITTTTAYYAEGSNISISWNAVPGNTYYWINVYKNDELIVNQSMGNETTYTLEDAAKGEYTFAISANNSAGTSGGTSYSFLVGLAPEVPTITTTATYYAAGTDVTVNWSAVLGNTYYWINIYKDEELIVNETAGNQTSFTFKAVEAGEYIFVVSANNGAGNNGSAKYLFLVEQPPEKPVLSEVQSNYDIGESITISWDPVVGNVYYWVTAYKDGEKFANQTLGNATSYSIPSAAEGQYIIYISANNGAGTSGSVSCKFTVGPIQYTVEYDANGGSNAPESQTKIHGEDLALSNSIPTRSGYTFLGWATISTATEAEYQPGDTFTIDSDTILYAVWEKEPVTLNSIEVISRPTKTIYEIGESLDTTGLTLKATYSDGSTKTITSGFTTSGFDSSVAGEKIVTVTYGGMSTSFMVTVKESEEVVPDAPQIVIESQAVTGGQTITVEITAANMPNVKSLMIENFQYDSNMLEFVSAELNLENAFIADWDSTAMIATVAFTENADINGVIMTMTFNVKEDVEGECSITCDVYANQLQTDGNETQVELSVVAGTITVMSYERGDVNGDGYVNSNDAIYLLRYTLSPNRYPINQSGDMNGDGYVNSNDAIYLLRHTLSPARYPLY